MDIAALHPWNLSFILLVYGHLQEKLLQILMILLTLHKTFIWTLKMFPKFWLLFIFPLFPILSYDKFIYVFTKTAWTCFDWDGALNLLLLLTRRILKLLQLLSTTFMNIRITLTNSPVVLLFNAKGFNLLSSSSSL